MFELAVFLAGVSLGIALYRFFIISVLRPPQSICDLCEFCRKKEELFPKRKQLK